MKAKKLEMSLANLCGTAMAGIKPSAMAVCAEEERGALTAYAHVFSRKGIRIEPLSLRAGNARRKRE